MTKKEMQSILDGMTKLLKYLMKNSDKVDYPRAPHLERQYQAAKKLVARAEAK